MKSVQFPTQIEVEKLRERNKKEQNGGSVSRKLEVNVSASEIWKAYGSLQLAQIAVDAFPETYSGYTVLEGDGYAGTIIQVFMAPGVAGPAWYKQKYSVVDDVRRVKVAPTIEGGVLEQGFKSYITRLEAIEKKGKSETETETDECIMIGTVEYVLEDESAFPLVATSIEGLYDIMKVVADYVIKHHNTTTN
ncbi:UNVERIFIED_CONTAM: hypothetical protein Scaly_2759700 [Sesamum calycinum]|uniref:Bet v I/Major latex protein domain-containing protein n=1 Tax=Sesamum calycinum TaxID=2727403 RepID=A0AAW2IZL9_9LAMI